MRLDRILACCVLMLAVRASAETISVPGGVSLEVPEGFTQLSPKEIRVKFPSARAPSFAVGNERRSTTIACDLKDDDMASDQLQDAKAAFEPLLERVVPGIEWKQRKLMTIQNQQWIYLEMTSRAADTDIHNVMLVTSLNGKRFLCNFNSTKEEFPQVEAALRRV